MGLMEVASEDQRFTEKDAPPLSEEFPEGSKIFFLGEHAYGAAAQVSSTTETTLSVVLAVGPVLPEVSDYADWSCLECFPAERAENEKFTKIAKSQVSAKYYPAYTVADMLSISGLALSKITASLMIATSDDKKTNLGLNLKFEAKSMKVLNYTRKTGRAWEFSEEAIKLIREYKVSRRL